MNEDDNQQQAAAHQDDLNRQEQIEQAFNRYRRALHDFWQAQDEEQMNKGSFIGTPNSSR